jgi:hypothetical protein
MTSFAPLQTKLCQPQKLGVIFSIPTRLTKIANWAKESLVLENLCRAIAASE